MTTGNAHQKTCARTTDKDVQQPEMNQKNNDGVTRNAKQRRGDSRPAYIREIVGSVNARLKADRIKDQSDPLFVWACDYLVRKNCYDGFYFAKDRPLPDGTTAKGVSAPDFDYDYLRLL